ncbi:MAG: hypothetical protein Q7K42_05140, partial [Candidatus Diapherotrites archaeon]|nr:hypothetical protein [Candidatus Diapherotrites archaeon]
MKSKNYKFNFSDPKDRALLLQAVFEKIIFSEFLPNSFTFQNRDKLYAVLRIISAKIGEKGILEFSSHCRHGLRGALERVLFIKGIPIPETVQALDDILAQSSLASRFGLKRKFRNKN